MTIQKAQDKHMASIINLYREAFPEAERKPFDLIRQKAEKGQMEILVIEEGVFIGLAITALYKDKVLLDYFAIDTKWRGEGIGSKVLSYLKERYKDKYFFLEVEVIDKTAENYLDRVRRKAFYHRNGLIDMEIYASLFGVKLEVLAFQKGLTYEAYYEVYHGVFGEAISSHMSQIEYKSK